METDLYHYQCKNILTYFSYYSSIKQRAENYYFFIKQYKKYTSEYLNTITFLLNSFTPSFSKNKNNNKKNTHNIQINIKENKLINESELDLSPLDKITSMIYKEFQEQISSLKFFLKNIDISLDNFNGIINQTQLEVEKQKNKYINSGTKFIESITNFKKENEDIIKDLSFLEEKIIKYYFMNIKLAKNNNYNYIKDENDDEINKEIKQLKEKENAFMNKENNKLTNFINFNNEMENYCGQIKNNIFLLIKIFKLSISSFSKYFLNYFNLQPEKNTIKKINIQKENKKEEFNEYELSINKNLKSINNNTIKSSLVQTKLKLYTPKVLKTDTINVSKEIFEILKKEIINLDIFDIDLNMQDTLYIMEKIYGFNLLDKKNYDIEKEKQKIIINDLMEKLFLMKKEDENYDKIMEEEAKKLCKYIEIDTDYRTYFLIVLGNQRSNTNIELSQKLFDIFSKMFNFISDVILKEKDYETENNLLILSQTFYKLDKDTKIYLYVSIKNHQLFQSDENWIEFIKYQISSDANSKILYNEKIEGKKGLNQKNIKNLNNQIIYSQIISANQSMKNFDLDNNKINNIINTLIKFYTILTPETKEEIIKFIKMENM